METEKTQTEEKAIAFKPLLADSFPLSSEVKKFIVWLYQKDEWRYDSTENLWTKEGWRSRTTQQLFDYYMEKAGNFR